MERGKVGAAAMLAAEGRQQRLLWRGRDAGHGDFGEEASDGKRRSGRCDARG
jgi:hypothetical protein